MLLEGWSGPGQTQSLQLAALIVAGSELNEQALVAERVRDLLVNAPGFKQYSGHQEEIQNKQVPGRAACRKAACFNPVYKGSWKEKANTKRSDEATDRATSALQRAEEEKITWTSITSAIATLMEQYGAPQKRWWYMNKNYQYLSRLKNFVKTKY